MLHQKQMRSCREDRPINSLTRALGVNSGCPGATIRLTNVICDWATYTRTHHVVLAVRCRRTTRDMIPRRSAGSATLTRTPAVVPDSHSSLCDRPPTPLAETRRNSHTCAPLIHKDCRCEKRLRASTVMWFDPPVWRTHSSGKRGNAPF